MSEKLVLDGNTLTLEDVERVARADDIAITMSEAARARVVAARAVVEAAVREHRVVYGITTGFGALAEVVIPPDRIRELQYNLIRSHAAGVGAPLPEEEVRAITLLRANVLALGHSGVRPDVIELLMALLNHGIHPVIPERGSVGASGDLAPLSHLALVLLGEGEALYQRQRIPGAEALRIAGLQPLVLEAKEGLALNNGTQVQTGIGILAFCDVRRALETAEVAGAMSLEGLRGTPDAFHEAIQRARPQPGQVESAARLRALLADSEIRESHRENDPRVQDAYSLRCMPQVHGAARQALGYIARVLETEANSATDNPLIFPEEGLVLSGGNFHGQPVAQVLDLLAMVCADLAAISERRIARLVDPNLSGLPPFLVRDPGVNSGMMMPQIVAAALVADLRLKAHPASTDSIPTDNNKEDHVSMGQGAALKAREAARLLETVIALELLVGAQALEFLKPLRPGKGVQRAYQLVRAEVRALDSDRYLAPDIEAITRLVHAGAFASIHRELPSA
ncbi:MAG TPA: histidine ammonia-lyase [Longimicrobiales bacterium]|nr:histidine ammonia-lyase [Longimicrobiales bacterium]